MMINEIERTSMNTKLDKTDFETGRNSGGATGGGGGGKCPPMIFFFGGGGMMIIPLPIMIICRGNF